MSSQAVPIIGVWDRQHKAVVGSYSLLLSEREQNRALDLTLNRNDVLDYDLVLVEDWAAWQNSQNSQAPQIQKEG